MMDRANQAEMAVRIWVTFAIASGLVMGCGSSTPNPAAGELPTATQSLVTILTPEEGAVVNVPSVEVRGEALPGTVITLDDEIVVVDESGEFAVTLPLEEGPNAIQVVASDADGNEASFEWVVTYDPGS